jgi:hypothetical protein
MFCAIWLCCYLLRLYNNSDRWTMNMEHWLMSLAGENWSTHRETCVGTNLSTTNPALSLSGLKQCLWFERPVTDCVGHGTTKQAVGLYDNDRVCFLCSTNDVKLTSVLIGSTVLLIHHSFSGISASRWWLIASKLWEPASKEDYRNWAPLVTGTTSQTK